MKKSITILFFVLLVFVQISDAQYYYNRAFSFSGVAGDYVATEPGSGLSITGSFTVECWVKPVNVASPSYQIIVQKRLGSTSSGYTMYLSTGKVAVRTNSTSRLTGTTVIPDNAWSHIAATYNSSTNVFTVYVNGVADGTVTTAGAAPNADTDSLRMANGFNSPYNGLIDEVRVWNVARTQAEIQSTMRMPLGEKAEYYQGLVASWRANAYSAGSGIEEINGYTAHLRGPATYADLRTYPNSHLAFNTGVKFPGIAGHYIAAPNTAAFNITGSFTLECWVNPVNVVTPSFQILIQKRNGSASAGYTLYLSNGKVCVRTNSSTRLTGTTVIPNGVWSHVAATYNSSTNVFTVYVNGNPDGTVTTAGAAPNADTDSLRLGVGFNSPYAGLMDEARISDYEKTPQEIQKGMFVSIDGLNEPNPSNTNIAYSFEGSLKGYDGATRGKFFGDVQFTRVFNNFTEFPAPANRYYTGNFANGYRMKYAGLTFGAAPITITDSFYFGQSLSISDVNVFAAIHHSYANDVSISLKNPAGTTTRVLYPGGSPDVGMHMITIFDDQADSSIGNTIRAPFSPRVKPTNALSVFNGQNSVGWWKLIITDIYPGADNGKLVGWGIQFNNQTLTGIGNENNITTPFIYELNQNYPNPFNPTTTINFSVAKESFVKINVYDILGREVMVLVNEQMNAGKYSVTLNAARLSSGVYFYRIEAGNFIDVKKMTVLK
ncbi:MAG: T9SS type A sorting domain-containing protein [Ignavibacteria bacterium]|nr:T9SS type A sorting domain-containing protein [Ignavibacteria bacterium]